MDNIKKHEDSCETCHDKQAWVPFFIHENAMMHKDMDNERMERVVNQMAKITKGQRIINFIQSIVILLIVFIFVWFYTSRAQIWSNTIMEMKQAIVEVSHAKENSYP